MDDREHYADPDPVVAWLAWDERPVVWTLIGVLSLLAGVLVYLGA